MVSSVKSRPSHYETLGLTPTATADDIAEAFATTSRKHIEDPRATEPDMRERARQIRMAHETLRDPAKRSAYDESLGLASEPEPDRTEAAAEPNAVPFVAATPRKPAKRRARAGKPPDRKERAPEASAEQSPRPFMAAATQRPAKQPAPEDSPDPSPQPEAQGPTAPAEPLVTPFVAAALRDPVKRRAYYTSPARSPEPQQEPEPELQPEPEPQLRPEVLSEHSTDPEVGPDEEFPRIYVDTAVPDVEESRARPNRAAAAAVALLAAVALFALLMWPLGGNVDRMPSTPSARTAPSAGAPPMASNAMPQLPQQTPPVADDAFQLAEETGGSLSGSVAPNDTGPVPTPIAPAERSAPALVSTSQQPVEVPPVAPEPAATAAATGPAAAAPPAAATEPAAAAPTAADRQSPPAGPTQAVAGGAEGTAPAPALNRETPARVIGGALTGRDNPRGELQGTVSVRFLVGRSGQVTGCQATASSGNPALDARTCALVAQKLRFSPALNPQGRPITSEMRATYTWGRTQRSITGRLLDLVRKRQN